MTSGNSSSSMMIAIAATASAAAVVAATIASSYLLDPVRKKNAANNKESSVSSSDPGPPCIPEPLLQSPYAQELELAVRLACQAGSNMKGYLHAKGTVEESNFDLGILETKSNSVDFCTKVDVENEHYIMKGIQSMFPSHDIIGEETVGTGRIPPLKKDTPTWIIDPIDGTTNFSQGLFMTCISIGFCVNGRPVMGVVYAPAMEEWYVAVKGYGAFRNGAQIIRQRNPKTSLETAVVCCEFGYSRKQDEIDAMLGAVSKILQNGCRAIRQLGSGVLDLCYVATGRLDIVYSGIVSEGWKPWDYTAGLVICEEAGCVMETIHQKPNVEFDLYGKSVICGVSRELVDDLRAVLVFEPNESGINWRPL